MVNLPPAVQGWTALDEDRACGRGLSHSAIGHAKHDLHQDTSNGFETFTDETLTNGHEAHRENAAAFVCRCAGEVRWVL
jgi:hypothetical protein